MKHLLIAAAFLMTPGPSLAQTAGEYTFSREVRAPVTDQDVRHALMEWFQGRYGQMINPTHLQLHERTEVGEATWAWRFTGKASVVDAHADGIVVTDDWQGRVVFSSDPARSGDNWNISHVEFWVGRRTQADLDAMLVVAQKEKIRHDFAVISRALDAYMTEHFDVPDIDEGLKALLQNSKAAAFYSGRIEPYLQELPIDPWGRPYVYEKPFPGRFVLRTLGADGAAGGAGLNQDFHTERD